MRSEVQILPDPPLALDVVEASRATGAIAQLVERLLCKQEVVGSIPTGSTKSTNQYTSAIRLVMMTVLEPGSRTFMIAKQGRKSGASAL